MLATEARGYGPFLEGIIDCVTTSLATRARVTEGTLRRAEELLKHNIHAAEYLGHEEVFASFLNCAFSLIEPLRPWKAEAFWRRSRRRCILSRGGVKVGD